MKIIDIFSGSKKNQIKYICKELELPFLESMTNMNERDLDIMYNQIMKFKKQLSHIKEVIKKYKRFKQK